MVGKYISSVTVPPQYPNSSEVSILISVCINKHVPVSILGCGTEATDHDDFVISISFFDSFIFFSHINMDVIFLNMDIIILNIDIVILKPFATSYINIVYKITPIIIRYIS